MKIRSVVFSAIICVLLCGPAALFLAERSGLSVPSVMTAADANYLSGSASSADVCAVANLSGFASKAFQEAVETEVSAHIPAKAVALLETAAWQRKAIRLSNAVFGWECYPTFYGSDIVGVPSQARLAEIAKKADSDLQELGKRISAELAGLSESFPDKRFFVYLGPDTSNAEGNPTAGLISDSLVYEGIEALFDDVNGSFKFINANVSFDDFDELWFKSDHHWNIEGSYEGYARIAEALGFGDDLVDPGELISHEEPLFWGALARQGLMLDYPDHIADYAFDDLPDFTVRINGAEASMEDVAHRGKYAQGKWDSNRYANRYAEYFHSDKGIIEFGNPDTSSENGLLIVTDSYSNSMERLLAAHYHTTYALDPRHTSQTVAQFLREHEDVTDVVIMMREANLLYETTEEALAL